MTAATALHRDYDSAPEAVADQTTTRLSPVLAMLPDLFAPASPARTLQTVVDLARRSFGCDGAGIILTAEDGGFGAATASGSDALRADLVQVEDHQGPAFGAIAGWQPVVSSELRFDSRWRFWGPKAADLGFRSVMALPLADGDSFGALTLYSRRPAYFSASAAGDELAFAQQASYAIAIAVEREQLMRARDSRGRRGSGPGHPDGALPDQRRTGVRGAPALLVPRQPEAAPCGRAAGPRPSPAGPRAHRPAGAPGALAPAAAVRPAIDTGYQA